MYCTICGSPEEYIFTAKILGKYDAPFVRCNACGFLHCQNPFWLEEAYSNAIADTDVGLVARNMLLKERLPGILYFLFDPKGRYLDYAGGYGMFCRLMRDIGFDFYWMDKHCQNLLAKGCELPTLPDSITAVTAFEVLEHVPDPADFVQKIFFEYAPRALIFTTTLYQDSPPTQDWWYYSFETGQHISFYTLETLKALAHRHELFLYSWGDMHILSREPLSGWKLCLFRRPFFTEFATRFAKKRMRSRLQNDYLRMKARLIDSQSTCLNSGTGPNSEQSQRYDGHA